MWLNLRARLLPSNCTAETHGSAGASPSRNCTSLRASEIRDCTRCRSICLIGQQQLPGLLHEFPADQNCPVDEDPESADEFADPEAGPFSPRRNAVPRDSRLGDHQTALAMSRWVRRVVTIRIKAAEPEHPGHNLLFAAQPARNNRWAIDPTDAVSRS